MRIASLDIPRPATSDDILDAYLDAAKSQRRDQYPHHHVEHDEIIGITRADNLELLKHQQQLVRNVQVLSSAREALGEPDHAQIQQSSRAVGDTVQVFGSALVTVLGWTS